VRFANPETMGLPTDRSPDAFQAISIASDPSEVRRVQEVLESLLKATHFNEHEIFGIKLALEEALVNAMKHGNQMDRSKRIHISYQVLPDRFDIHLVDEGEGFDPCDVPDPTSAENLERPCGRGLMLMRHYMTQVDFGPRGNSVRMSKVARNGKK
jgi:serine/threonine-protein kinase RsbW